MTIAGVINQLELAQESSLWKDKLTLLLESTADGIFGIDLAGRCTFMNRAAAAMLGYELQAVLGLNMHALVHYAHCDGRHYPEEECPIFQAFRKGQPCRVDQEVFWRADGTPFPVEYSSHQIVDQGQIRGAVITFTDISARRHAEEALQRAKQELEVRVAERTQELSAALAQLRELSAHADLVREEERKRIAREVHDELGSLLVALKLDVKWMVKRVGDREQLVHKCDSMIRLIDSAVENVGRIITDLRPSILDHQGLIAALEWQIQEFAEATELDCATSIEVDPEVRSPEGNLGTAVFRIFQEMLSNVARHANASAVRIEIRLTHTALYMMVEDNGVGAPRNSFERSNSYGVIGMRERALHFGGTVDIDSVPGRGTCVRLALPLVVNGEGVA